MKSQTLEEVKAEYQSRKHKPEKERQKKDWFGLVYCREWASVSDENSRPIWLGKTDDLIPYYKERGFDGENVDVAIQLAKEYTETLKNDVLKSPEITLRGSRKGVNAKTHKDTRAKNLTNRKINKNHKKKGVK